MDVKKLREWAEKRGYRVSWTEAGVLDDVRSKLEARNKAGVIDGEFYKEYLADFSYLDASAIEGPKILVMVAVPRPAHLVTFSRGEMPVDTVLPPTYVRYRQLFEDVREDLRSSVLCENAAIEILRVPLKSLAVHIGLAAYGRNNITYISEFGSAYQLCGYVVAGTDHPGEIEGDLPAGERDPEAVMAKCTSCRACVIACPTGAITPDRFLIRAERCFTLHSESASPIPDWISPPRRMSLIGCMACQEICPLNKGRLKTEPAGVDFAAEETEAFLEAGRRGAWNALPLGAEVSARAKFEGLGLTEGIAVFGRNLGLVLKKREERGQEGPSE